MSGLYPESRRHLERALKVTPMAAQTMSRSPERFPIDAHPLFLERGDAAHVFDIDGNEYIDWVSGLCAVTLGYNNDIIDSVVRAQLACGVTFSLPTKMEAEVAERLCALIPCAEMVRFLKTGSEATEAAVRVARAATGRDIVLSSGYHGWHSQWAVLRDEHPGVPEDYSQLIYEIEYNNLQSLDKLITYFGDYVAAIILEPTFLDPPAPGFLEGVRERATKIGAVLIFDEIVTGFRWHPGGYQAICGVTPDLATFGKAMANGWPLAALVGRRDLMEHARLVSGTFGGEAVSLAACNAVLSIYEREKVCEYIRETGQTIMDYARSLNLIVRGQAPHPIIAHWNQDLFMQELARFGLLFHPAGINPSFAHTETDIKATKWSMLDAVTTIDRGATLIGRPSQPISLRPPAAKETT